MIIYHTPNCPRCKLLAVAFQKAGIPYEEENLSEMSPAEKASYICDIGGYPMSAPIVKNGNHWFTSEDSIEDILADRRETKVFSGIGGQPDRVERSSSKIWGVNATPNAKRIETRNGAHMIGKVKDIIEDEDSAVAMVAISIGDAKQLWEMVGKDVVIAWV